MTRTGSCICCGVPLALHFDADNRKLDCTAAIVAMQPGLFAVPMLRATFAAILVDRTFDVYVSNLMAAEGDH